MTENLGLVPLFNFGEITTNLYRAGQPAHEYQYRWLRDTLGIDLIINLRAEKPTIDEGYGMFTTTYLVDDHKAPTDEQAKEFMDMIRAYQKNGVKVLIHCEHGHGRTSTFSVLAKMALGCTVDQALQDERERFHISFNHPAQEQWLRDFAEREERREKLVRRIAPRLANWLSLGACKVGQAPLAPRMSKSDSSSIA